MRPWHSARGGWPWAGVVGEARVSGQSRQDAPPWPVAWSYGPSQAFKRGVRCPDMVRAVLPPRWPKTPLPERRASAPWAEDRRCATVCATFVFRMLRPV